LSSAGAGWRGAPRAPWSGCVAWVWGIEGVSSGLAARGAVCHPRAPGRGWFAATGWSGSFRTPYRASPDDSSLLRRLRTPPRTPTTVRAERQDGCATPAAHPRTTEDRRTTSLRAAPHPHPAPAAKPPPHLAPSRSATSTAHPAAARPDRIAPSHAARSPQRARESDGPCDRPRRCRPERCPLASAAAPAQPPPGRRPHAARARRGGRSAGHRAPASGYGAGRTARAMRAGGRARASAGARRAARECGRGAQRWGDRCGQRSWSALGAAQTHQAIRPKGRRSTPSAATLSARGPVVTPANEDFHARLQRPLPTSGGAASRWRRARCAGGRWSSHLPMSSERRAAQ
jgi:hypothetical protein